MAFENGDATVEIVRCQMGVAHRHRQRLVAEPDLHTPDVDAAAASRCERLTK
jgi:hypothetical protein